MVDRTDFIVRDEDLDLVGKVSVRIIFWARFETSKRAGADEDLVLVGERSDAQP